MPAAGSTTVVQWTTGNVGRRSTLAILDHPELTLVGCYVTAAGGKAGKDVSDIVGLHQPTGVVATADVDALLALKPHCVVYNPKFISVDELVRILGSGANVVTTANFITGHCLGDDRKRLLDACAKGRSSIFGSGMNPGFANLLGIVATGICERVDKVTVVESVDSTGYDSPETEIPVGFGRPIDAPELPAMARTGTGVFEDAVHLTADALGIELDDVRCEAEFAQTTEDLDLGSWHIAAGCVAGIAVSWQGIVDDQVVVDLRVRWRKGQTLNPDWTIEHGYIVDVVGMPNAHLKYEIWPPADFKAQTMSDFMALGMAATAMPAVQVIPAVCAAVPGIVTYNDIPLTAARGFTRGSR
ncbi:dihydrodipicolinate reductase [Mycolicibacterium septicum]|uniref:NAD(P)H-dependent amine dehydrogenase family protein n=1 Tax=Mycolicibacterium septicum TaxID=98668 RepID=UPI00235E6EDD|nr:dihydrodipicolinate reductase [Mycolicibacterium septicum]